MWDTTQSSKCDFAPGARFEGVFAGLAWRHWTALVYDILSSALRSPLSNGSVVGHLWSKAELWSAQLKAAYNWWHCHEQSKV